MALVHNIGEGIGVQILKECLQSSEIFQHSLVDIERSKDRSIYSKQNLQLHSFLARLHCMYFYILLIKRTIPNCWSTFTHRWTLGLPRKQAMVARRGLSVVLQSTWLLKSFSTGVMTSLLTCGHWESLCLSYSLAGKHLPLT